MTLSFAIEEYSTSRAGVLNRGGTEAPTLTYCLPVLIPLIHLEEKRHPEVTGGFATFYDPETLIHAVPLSFLKRIQSRDTDQHTSAERDRTDLGLSAHICHPRA